MPCHKSSRRTTNSHRCAFESLEQRLALAVDLEFAASFERLGGTGSLQFSSPLDMRGGGLITDDAGNRYVTLNGTGENFTDLDPGAAVEAATIESALVKLDPSGAFVWSAPLNATNTASPVIRILHAVDADQNVYMVGDFRGTVDLDPGPGVQSRTSSEAGTAYSVYMLKLNSAGQLQWLHTWNETEFIVDRIAADRDGNIVISCSLDGVNGPIDVDLGPNEMIITPIGAANLLALKYTTNGELVWAKQIGSTNGNLSARRSLDVSEDGNVLIAGGFIGTLDLDPGIGSHLVNNPDASSDGFVVQLDAAGEFVAAYATEGAGSTAFFDVEAADDGSVVVGGFFRGTVDFQPGSGSVALISVGNHVNGLALKLQSDLFLTWAHRFGGPGETLATDIDVDAQGNVFLGGSWGRLTEPGQSISILGRAYTNSSGHQRTKQRTS